MCGIVFIRWLRAAYRNLDLLAPGVRRYGHGSAIGAWFVPFLNLLAPEADHERRLARQRHTDGLRAAAGAPPRVVAVISRGDWTIGPR